MEVFARKPAPVTPPPPPARLRRDAPATFKASGFVPDGPVHAKLLHLAAVRAKELTDAARGIPPFREPTIADLEVVRRC